MKWKVLLAVSAVGGGVVWAARRRSRQEAADSKLWSDATDPVTRFGPSAAPPTD